MSATLGQDRIQAQTAIEARVLGFAAVRAWPEELDRYRKQPTPNAPAAFSPSLLRHSENQTVAAVWATCAAAAQRDAVTYTNWGVIAAPCLMGRAANAASLEQFAREGPWGISPHLIPHHSLHAISGAISQIFQTHGPNFGVGNGPSSGADAWLTAATLLSEGVVPGLWLVIVGTTEEYLPALAGAPANRVQYEAAALALGTGDGSGMHLRISPEGLAFGRDGAFLKSLPAFSLGELVDELFRTNNTPAGIWAVPGLGWVEIDTR